MSDSDHAPREESFISHLIELRSRLMRAIAAVLLVFLALLPFAQNIYGVFAAPLLEQMPAGGKMIAIDVVSPFFAPIKLTFVLALMLTVPFVLYQIWAFVAPGLYRHEKRLAVPLLASATLLFYVGCAFAWGLALPLVFAFMTAVTPEGVAMMTDITRYLDFVLVTLLAFGCCFEVPVAVVILVLLGWVDDAKLREARPYVIVGAFVIAAVVTPPDITSMLLLAIPMCLLYEVGIVASRMLVRSRAQDGRPQEH